MAPNGFLNDAKSPRTYEDENHQLEKKPIDAAEPVKQTIKWPNVIGISILHLMGVYGLYSLIILAFVDPMSFLKTYLFSNVYGFASGIGVTAGAHRLWTHRSYKARVPLRILLSLMYSATGMNTIPDWVRDHRIHHKFSETDADPHNSNRGFFFAHVGWLMLTKHPEVVAKGKLVDMSDITNDPVVHYHTKYFTELKLIFAFIVPIIIPCYFWGATLHSSTSMTLVRYVCILNSTWLVNSAAHLYGYHPFSTRIRPAENKVVSILTNGEGWHNYHHIFPWDYRAAELGQSFNLTTRFLDFFATMGWAYDRKYPSADLVERVARRFGDGTHKSCADHVREVDESGKEVEDLNLEYANLVDDITQK